MTWRPRRLTTPHHLSTVREHAVKLLNSTCEKNQRSLKKRHAQQRQLVDARTQALVEELDHKHDIEQAELEREIGHMRNPPIKWSPRYISLEKAERALTLQHEYRQAADVKRMLKKLRPKEVAAHQRRWGEVLEHKRKILLLRQEQEVLLTAL